MSGPRDLSSGCVVFRGCAGRLEVCPALERHGGEEIVATLREAEKPQVQGLTIPQTC